MESHAMKPDDIETESFRIIDEEVGTHDWNSDEWQVVRRAIHTSADFEYARSMIISDNALLTAIQTLKNGCGIVTDTTMALSGISKAKLSGFDCNVTCHIADSDVAERAQQEGTTRSVTAMRKAVENCDNKIFVIGNAPTALFELLHLIECKKIKPALIIGLPVGFVGAEESKNALATETHQIPFITNIGRKGGSNVAAAVVNALAILAAR